LAVDAVGLDLNISENRIGTDVIASAMAVHSALGPGLLENTYETCLAYELSKRARSARKEVALPLRYGELVIDNAFRIDLLVDNLVVIEIKAVETVHAVHRGQLLSYLRMGGYRLGYLLNFNVLHMRDGVIRQVNGL
jgi:GxxExxY protein